MQKIPISVHLVSRFYALATYLIVENGHCEGVICESVSEREFYQCDCIIDATGDGSECALTGEMAEKATVLCVKMQCSVDKTFN